METGHLNSGVALFPKFGVGDRKGSLPPDCFLYLAGHTLKMLQIPEGGDTSRSSMCRAKHDANS